MFGSQFGAWIPKNPAPGHCCSGGNRMTSRLVSLAPAGIATDQVESLTSYIRRVSLIHAVSPSTLLRELVLKPHRISQGERHLLFEPTRVGESLNGAGKASNLILQALGILTGIETLQSTTVAGMADGIEFRTSFRQWRSWCPNCLLSSSPYDRLAWTFRSSVACIEHRLRLVDQCGRCGQQHRPLHHGATPTLCPWCGTSLAAADQRPAHVSRHDAVIHEIIGLREQGSPFDAATVVHAFRVAVDILGGLRRLAAAAQLSPAEASAIAHTQARPSLETIVRALAAAGLSYEAAITAAPPKLRTSRGGGPLRRRSVPRIGFALAQAVALPDESLPALRALARNNRVSPGFLRTRYPSLTAAIVARRREYESRRRQEREFAQLELVRSVVERLRIAGRPLTRRMVEEELRARAGLIRAPHVRALLRDQLGGPNA